MPAPAVTTLRDALIGARHQIELTGSNEAALEAELLLMHALRIDRARLYASLHQPLDAEADERLAALMRLRLAHEPVAYITGHREFFGLDFEVSPAALIPRPETETLVELAIDFARERGAPLTIADIGTGTGAVAIALAQNLPAARIIATDISAEALALANRNAQTLGVADRVELRLGDLLETLTESVDIIVANLPYVTTAQWGDLPPEIRDNEPRMALDGGADGLEVVRRLIADAPAQLSEGGALFCEIGDWQGEAVRDLARKAFPNAHFDVRPDLAGRDRVLAVYS